MHEPPISHGPKVWLTSHRIGIIRLLASDKCPEEIASLLQIDRYTVYEHLKELRKKLQVHTSYGLVGLAYELGILRPTFPEGKQDSWAIRDPKPPGMKPLGKKRRHGPEPLKVA